MSTSEADDNVIDELLGVFDPRKACLARDGEPYQVEFVGPDTVVMTRINDGIKETLDRDTIREEYEQGLLSRSDTAVHLGDATPPDEFRWFAVFERDKTFRGTVRVRMHSCESWQEVRSKALKQIQGEVKDTYHLLDFDGSNPPGTVNEDADQEVSTGFVMPGTDPEQ